MATPEERQEKIEKAKENISALANIKASTLARTEDLSKDLNFSEAVPFFEEMLDIIKQLNQRDISRLTFNQLDDILGACNKISRGIKLVNEFNLNVNAPAKVCKDIITNLKNAYDEIVGPLILPLAFTATQATDYAKIEREAKGYHATIKEEAESFRKVIDSYKNEAEKALQAVKKQAADAGVSVNAQIFLTDSGIHAKAAKKWLIATIIISSVTLAVAIGFVCISFGYDPGKTAIAIQYVVSKIILLSTLSFGIFWCVKNYKSSKHNETLNKHRANALSTFKTFVEGSGDVAIKDAILLHAAQAAFVNRPTGYESQEREAQSINPVVEILGKSLIKSGSNKL
tara:strand:+ start:434 stop:1462 length:1029 start_codon:yes stop_codon:yes gene_type:complete